MGLRGSGQIYALPSDSCWAQLGLQRSTWSDRDVVEFTANLSVVTRASWAAAAASDEWLGAKPSPNLHASARDRFQERIGQVMGGDDYWWRLTADGSDEDATCGDFLAIIAEHGIPALQREVASRT